jgi:hypothetical protein
MAVCLTVVALVLLAVALSLGARSASGASGQESSRQASIREIRLVFGRYAPAALRVVYCESRYDSRAVSSHGGNYGLFQANYRAHHWRRESIAAFARRHFNVPYHVRWAFRLSRGGRDWSAWSCRP